MNLKTEMLGRRPVQRTTSNTSSTITKALVVILLCGIGSLFAASSARAQTVLFTDDFNQTSIDTVHWYLGENQWSTSNNGVVPQNVSLTQVTDPSTGQLISVLDAQAHGDNYTGSVPGVTSLHNGFDTNDPRGYSTPGPYGNGSVRTGGLLVSRLRWGPAKYQIRLKNLPQVGGDSAIWNYYDPAYNPPGSGLYSEIDIEMPANGTNGNLSSSGLNSFETKPGTDPGDDDQLCNCINKTPGNQADGNFHLWEIDWYDGTDGTTPRIDWYFDGTLVYESTKDIPTDAAQFWVGNWPAPWSYTGTWNYTTQDQYIDYVKVMELSGDSYPTSASAAPSALELVVGSNTTADLAWQESADSRTIAGYNVYANGTLITQTPATHVYLQGLTPGTAYSFTVAAVNTGGFVSSLSNTANYTTLTSLPSCGGDITSPITGLSASGATVGEAVLSWTAPVNGTKGGTIGGSGCSVVGYEIARSQGGTVVKASTATNYTDTTVATTEYRYDVIPYNQYGSGPTLPVFVTTTAGAGCTTDPGQVTGLSATVSGNNVTLNWTAPSAGGSGCSITSYTVKRGGTTIASPTGTTYADDGLAAGSYSYTVTANNQYGSGTPSSPANATVTSGSCSADPGQVTGLTATVSGSNVSLTWTAPSAGGTGCTISSYTVKRGGTTIASPTTTTYADNGLAPGTYSYTVAANNQFGAGAASSAANATVTGSNLLTNPGFETGTLSGWSCVGTASVSTAAADSGSYGAQLTATSSTTAQCTQTVTGLTPGSVHTFSAQIKSTDMSAPWARLHHNPAVTQLLGLPIPELSRFRHQVRYRYTSKHTNNSRESFTSITSRSSSSKGAEPPLTRGLCFLRLPCY
jgi:hypothetical protein